MVIECHLDYPNWLLAPYWSESFRLFDADESGNIELDEMFEIVATFYDMEVPDTCKENSSEMDNQALLIDMLQIFAFYIHCCPVLQGEPREPAFEQAEEIFKALDVNGDGSLDEEEFVK